jgi:hypothetical protein
MNKYKIESYTVSQSKGRCWSCCQENCGFGECYCSCHSDKETITLYKILLNNRKIKDYFYSYYEAMQYKKTELNPKWRKSQKDKKIKSIRREIKRKQKELKKLLHD